MSSSPNQSDGERPESDKPTPDKIVGTVKWFNVKSGYGFINRHDTQEDVFVHRSAIKKNNPRKFLKSVGDGEIVEFDVIQGSKGLEAANVTGIGNTPVKGSEYAPNRWPRWFRPRGYGYFRSYRGRGGGRRRGPAQNSIGDSQMSDGEEPSDERPRRRRRGGGARRGRGRGRGRGRPGRGHDDVEEDRSSEQEGSDVEQPRGRRGGRRGRGPGRGGSARSRDVDRSSDPEGSEDVEHAPIRGRGYRRGRGRGRGGARAGGRSSGGESHEEASGDQSALPQRARRARRRRPQRKRDDGPADGRGDGDRSEGGGGD